MGSKGTAEMKVAFDNLRISIAQCYNDLTRTKLTMDQRGILEGMRSLIGGLLACHDPNDPDINAVHDRIELEELPK